MQKYRGVGMILLLLVLVFGAAAASVALEESAPGAASVIRRLVVVAGAGPGTDPMERMERQAGTQKAGSGGEP